MVSYGQALAPALPVAADEVGGFAALRRFGAGDGYPQEQIRHLKGRGGGIQNQPHA
jgi:hypothetical protein